MWRKVFSWVDWKPYLFILGKIEVDENRTSKRKYEEGEELNGDDPSLNNHNDRYVQYLKGSCALTLLCQLSVRPRGNPVQCNKNDN